MTRLRGYDYARGGYYFVTVCTHNRAEWFGRIENGNMTPNEYGNIVSSCWDDLLSHYANVKLDEFVVMPNHVHGIIVIENNVGNGLKPFPTQHGLSEIMRGFKTFSSRRINETINNGIKFHWQKSFYDKIVRDEKSLDDIRKYIRENPFKWESDSENPDVIRDSLLPRLMSGKTRV